MSNANTNKRKATEPDTGADTAAGSEPVVKRKRSFKDRAPEAGALPEPELGYADYVQFSLADNWWLDKIQMAVFLVTETTGTRFRLGYPSLFSYLGKYLAKVGQATPRLLYDLVMELLVQTPIAIPEMAYSLATDMGTAPRWRRHFMREYQAKRAEAVRAGQRHVLFFPLFFKDWEKEAAAAAASRRNDPMKSAAALIGPQLRDLEPGGDRTVSKRRIPSVMDTTFPSRMGMAESLLFYLRPAPSVKAPRWVGALHDFLSRATGGMFAEILYEVAADVLARKIPSRDSDQGLTPFWETLPLSIFRDLVILYGDRFADLAEEIMYSPPAVDFGADFGIAAIKAEAAQIRAVREKFMPRLDDLLTRYLDADNGQSLTAYQQSTLQWMVERELGVGATMPASNKPGETRRVPFTGGIISLEAGLGKTRTFLSLVKLVVASAPTLIVVPSAVLYDIQAENDKIFIIKDSRNRAHRLRVAKLDTSTAPAILVDATTADQDTGRYPKDVIITTREILMRIMSGVAGPVMRDILREFKFGRLIVDEIQNFTNRAAVSFNVLSQIKADLRWGVTGTPYRNKVEDLYNQLNLVGYTVTPSETTIRNPKKAFHDIGDDTKKEIMEMLQHIYMLKYGPSTAELPTASYYDKEVHLTETERKVYAILYRQLEANARADGKSIIDLLMEEADKELAGASADDGDDGAKAKKPKSAGKKGKKGSGNFVLTTPCRMACISLDLAYDTLKRIKNAMKDNRDPAKETPEEEKAVRHAIETIEKAAFVFSPTLTAGAFEFKPTFVSSAFRAAIDEILAWRRNAPDDKIIVFSTFSTVLAKLKDILQQQYGFTNRNITLFTGALAKGDVDAARDRFDHDDENWMIFVTYAKGAAGINLQRANNMLLFDVPYSPAMTLQAVARALRLNQRKPVTIVTMFTPGTIDDVLRSVRTRKMNDWRTMLDAYQDTLEDHSAGAGLDVVFPRDLDAQVDPSDPMDFDDDDKGHPAKMIFTIEPAPSTSRGSSREVVVITDSSSSDSRDIDELHSDSDSDEQAVVVVKPEVATKKNPLWVDDVDDLDLGSL